MRVLFLNPNSSVHMTQSITETARDVLPEADILGWTNHDGPPAIQGPKDGEAAIPGVIAQLDRARDAGVDVIVIACFDDVALTEARAAAHCPVIGIGQASFHMAALLGGRFGVVTTVPEAAPVIEANIDALGFTRLCTGVRPSGLGVLQVEAGTPPVLDRLAREILAAKEDGATSVVLGCAGMARHRAALYGRTGVPLVDGVRSGAALALGLARLSPARF
ncbi:allantoin racemase [Poseidonocella pacifica]|uniref:Allantoin racemase n=1 Tax=Poseidonocella pacifica TaxID=871651 RepID=A0A1I0VGT3_9RHOB|nr:aspartate/glutamate racemase family protein [Poseidonocella pacifica]SFA75531.1 allantoin racemase [Poseidonocella pacifica]